MFVITGATGHTGKVAAETLLAAGQKVRVLVRNPDKAKDLVGRGADVVVGDLSDREAVARAFSGARGVYLISPPDLATNNFLAERKALLETIARGAAAAKVPHVVFLSSLGAELTSGTGPIVTLHAGEQSLQAAGVPATFLRAGYFVENWASVLPVAKQDGVLPSFLPADLASITVSTRDIGQAAAQALLDGARGSTRLVDVAGPSEATPKDVAQAVGRILGREIKVVEAPLEAVVPTFTSFGISAHVAALYREMYEAMRKGLITHAPNAEVVRGRQSLEQTLRPLLG
ncbi:MAG TPA: NmrA family NAD(P)-binding protein [Polyangia bacterium]